MLMADEIRRVDTSKYVKEGKVEVDGNLWTVRLPGANTEMKLSRYQRRSKLLQKKVDNGTATEEDLDKYDMMEDFYFEFFKNIFSDGTEDNKSVHDWVDNTPISIIMQAFEDIKKQAAEKGE